MITQLVSTLQTILGPAPQPAPGEVCLPIGSALPQSGAVALAPVIALVVNTLAQQVQPASAQGQFSSSFARLSWNDKAEVWRRFEVDLPAAVLPPAWQLDVPVIGAVANLTETLGGLLAYASGAVLELVGLLTYTEGLAYNRSTGRLTGIPIGWRLSSYQLGGGPVDGWDEFRGYYQGRSSIGA